MEPALCELGMDFRSCSVKIFQHEHKDICVCVCARACVRAGGRHAKNISLYNRQCIQLIHAVICCSRYRMIYVVEISEICTEQLKIIIYIYKVNWKYVTCIACCSRKIGLIVCLFMLFC
jgi:hypothetical protein